MGLFGLISAYAIVYEQDFDSIAENNMAVSQLMMNAIDFTFTSQLDSETNSNAYLSMLMT